MEDVLASPNDLDRYMRKISIQPNGCWYFMTAKDRGGYAQFYSRGAVWKAHRVAYRHFCGPIPESHNVVQECGCRFCVAPDHLRTKRPVLSRVRSSGDHLADDAFRSRFLSRVHKIDNGCWLYMGEAGRGKYWQVRYKNVLYMAHRLTFRHFIGPIPEDVEVMHSCDVPNCVAPHHLSLGTHEENMADCSRKGRVGSRRLAAESVREIKDAYASGKYLQRELAAKYGVAQSQISRLLRGEAWKHA